jgi:hypothetical protein
MVPLTAYLANQADNFLKVASNDDKVFFAQGVL